MSIFTELMSGFNLRSAAPGPALLPSDSTDDMLLLRESPSSRAVSAKAEAVAQPVISAFDRSKATAEYTPWRTIIYTFVGAVRSVAPRFFQDKAQNLDHYQKHKEFKEGIEKASAAYQQFRAAEKAVQEAPKGKLLGLRRVELEKAKALVASYDHLIALAAGRADYQADIHVALEKTDDAMIFHTVNVALAKIRVGNGVSDLGEGERKELQKSCEQFLSNFAEHVQEAVAKTGATSPVEIKAATQKVINAFIAGLASFPELATGVDVIQMHAELVKLRDPSEIEDGAERQKVEAERAQMVSKVTEHFAHEIEKLLNGDKEITRGDLEKIHCQGIPLLLVKDFSDKDIEQFEDLRLKAKEKQEVIGELAELSKFRDAAKAGLDQKTAHRASDIMSFLEDVAAGKFQRNPAQVHRTLETAATEGVLTEGFKKFQDVRAEFVAVKAQFETAQTRASNEGEGFAQKIALYESMIDDASGEINSLTAEAEGYDRTVKGLKLGLEKLEDEYALGLQEMGSIMKSKPNAKKFFLGPSVKAGAAAHADDVQQINTQITEFAEKQVSAVRTAKTLLSQREEDRATLEDLKKEAAASEARNKADLEALAVRLNALAKAPIDLSGDELRGFAEYLGLGSVSSSQSSVYEALSDARMEQVRMADLNVEITANGQKIARLDAEMAKRPAMLLMAGNDRFTVDQRQAFGDDETRTIVKLLNDNLDIAKEVTARVAGTLAGVVQATREQDSAAAKGASSSLFAGMKTQFEVNAENIEQMEYDELVASLQRRVAMLPIPSQADLDDSGETLRMDPGSDEDRDRRIARVRSNPAPFRGVQDDAIRAVPQEGPVEIVIDEL